jgi:hypothetical protein
MLTASSGWNHSSDIITTILWVQLSTTMASETFMFQTFGFFLRYIQEFPVHSFVFISYFSSEDSCDTPRSFHFFWNYRLSTFLSLHTLPFTVPFSLHCSRVGVSE